MLNDNPSAPENLLRSRADLQLAFRCLEGALLRVWRIEGGGPDLGPHRACYDAAAGRVESISRLLWGLVPYSVGGGESAAWPLVLDAVRRGTDSADAQYWGEAGDCDQRQVEMAAFGFALRLAPTQIWEPLSPAERKRFSRWLMGAVTKELAPNNWQFFGLLVTLGLRHVGAAPPEADAYEQRALERIDS